MSYGDGMAAEERMRFVLAMRQAGLTDAKALAALERTPRGHYAPGHLSALAYDDVSLPLAHGQTMTKPSLIGAAIAALDVGPEHKVLEIGVGSGFQAGALATLARRVVSLDRWPALVTYARAKLGSARHMNAVVHLADGGEGYAAYAPYDRIVINAGVAAIPEPLLAQLAQGGVIVAALGAPEGQRLMRIEGGARADLGAVRLAMLEAGIAG